MIRSNPVKELLFILCLAMGFCISALAATPPPWYFNKVVPSNLSPLIEGADSSVVPFGSWPFPDFDKCNSCRYQQVIAAREFTFLPQENLYIWSILFRADTCNRESTQLSGFVIHLSTTQKAPDELSLNFAENIGPDEKEVIRGGGGFYGGADCGELPADFFANWYIMTNLNVFPYSPKKGNLLIDIEYTGKQIFGPRGVTMDAQTVLGDGISRVYGCPNTLETAQTADTTGLVLEFLFVRPELTVEDIGNSIRLEWSYRLPSFRLQVGQKFGASLSWTDYKGRIEPDGDIFTHATILKSDLGDARYFRLFSETVGPTPP